MFTSRKIANPRRRRFMQTVSAAGLSLAGGLPLSAFASMEDIPRDPWEQAQDIIDRLGMMPTFREQDFPVTEYGAAPCQLSKVLAWVTNEERERIDTPQ